MLTQMRLCWLTDALAGSMIFREADTRLIPNLLMLIQKLMCLLTSEALVDARDL